MSTQPPPDIIAAARAAQPKHGIPASISLAQWAVESAWGKRMPPGSNNPFGIKALPGQPSVTVSTREVDRYGRDYWIMAAFRRFASIAEAFDEHGRLLAQAGAYAKARAKLPHADAFADALTGVYATDPNYGSALKAVMRGSNLYQYDAAPVGKPVPVASGAVSPVAPRYQADTQIETPSTADLNDASLVRARGG